MLQLSLLHVYELEELLIVEAADDDDEELDEDVDDEFNPVPQLIPNCHLYKGFLVDFDLHVRIV